MVAALSQTMAPDPSADISRVGWAPAVMANSEPPYIDPTMLRVRLTSGSRMRRCRKSGDRYVTRPPVARKAGCRLNPARINRARHAGGKRLNQYGFTARTLQRFEHAGGAHASAHAHGDHAVLAAGAAQAVHPGGGADGPGGAIRPDRKS